MDQGQVGKLAGAVFSPRWHRSRGGGHGASSPLWQTQRAQPGQQRRRLLGGAPVSVRREEARDGASQGACAALRTSSAVWAREPGHSNVVANLLSHQNVRGAPVFEPQCLSRLSDVLKEQGS